RRCRGIDAPLEVVEDFLRPTYHFLVVALAGLAERRLRGLSGGSQEHGGLLTDREALVAQLLNCLRDLCRRRVREGRGGKEEAQHGEGGESWHRHVRLQSERGRQQRNRSHAPAGGTRRFRGPIGSTLPAGRDGAKGLSPVRTRCPTWPALAFR